VGKVSHRPVQLASLPSKLADYAKQSLFFDVRPHTTRQIPVVRCPAVIKEIDEENDASAASGVTARLAA
jgi:hypothetical protein